MTRAAPVPPVTAVPDTPAPARGALMMLAACAVLTINDAGMKALVADHPTGQIVSLRAMLGLVMLGAVTAATGRLDRLRPRGGRGTLVLAGMLVLSLFMFPLSLQFIPLADAIMLAYLGPVFVAILSPFVLRESVSAGGAGAPSFWASWARHW